MEAREIIAVSYTHLDVYKRQVLAEKYKEPAWHTYCIAGKNCESGDVLIDTIKLPEAKSGDLLAVYSTGAYGYSMASNYKMCIRDSQTPLHVRGLSALDFARQIRIGQRLTSQSYHIHDSILQSILRHMKQGRALRLYAPQLVARAVAQHRHCLLYTSRCV